jgi:hypothetical protein
MLSENRHRLVRKNNLPSALSLEKLVRGTNSHASTEHASDWKSLGFGCLNQGGGALLCGAFSADSHHLPIPRRIGRHSHERMQSSLQSISWQSIATTHWCGKPPDRSQAHGVIGTSLLSSGRGLRFHHSSESRPPKLCIWQ